MASKLMLITCVVCFAVGTYGLVRNIMDKCRQRKNEKHYAAVRKEAGNE